MSNALYCGDNLAVLRESIASESVDLIYLDPPFNSSANYNVLFKSPLMCGSVLARLNASTLATTSSQLTQGRMLHKALGDESLT
jgi:16S rRNA G966 N2-methylase RsmD